jgi:hypothetical protein
MEAITTRASPGGTDEAGEVWIPFEPVREAAAAGPLLLELVGAHVEWRTSLMPPPDLPPTPALAPRWPSPAIFQLEPDPAASDEEVRAVQQRVREVLLRQGYCVVVEDRTHEPLRDEARIGAMGRLNDLSGGASPAWLPATVLIRTDIQRTASAATLEVSWRDVDRGTVIHTERLALAPGTLAPALPQLTHMALRRLPPPMGCPAAGRLELTTSSAGPGQERQRPDPSAGLR